MGKLIKNVVNGNRKASIYHFASAGFTVVLNDCDAWVFNKSDIHSNFNEAMGFIYDYVELKPRVPLE